MVIPDGSNQAWPSDLSGLDGRQMRRRSSSLLFAHILPIWRPGSSSDAITNSPSKQRSTHSWREERGNYRVIRYLVITIRKCPWWRTNKKWGLTPGHAGPIVNSRNAPSNPRVRTRHAKPPTFHPLHLNTLFEAQLSGRSSRRPRLLSQINASLELGPTTATLLAIGNGPGR